VEYDVDDGGLRAPGGFDEGSLHGLEVVDGLEVAIEQLEQQVASQGVQSAHPPCAVRAIYRTSPAARDAPPFRDGEISAARRIQGHCMVRFLPLQEKNVGGADFRRVPDLVFPLHSLDGSLL
jgi:hypothetical protein